MATITSPGIGSGLDVKSIVSQLVALEKRPLTGLQTQASAVQAKISAFGQIKSLVSGLSDAASQLASVTAFTAVTATSTNSSAVTATAIGGTQPTAFSLSITALAKNQSTTSAALLPVGGAIGAGTFTITPTTGSAVAIAVAAGDTVSDIASKINGSAANVTATVLTDASGERLLLRSKNTGLANGYTLGAVETVPTGTGLSRLVTGSTTTQAAMDAAATINGVNVTSTTNTFSNKVSGVTFTALQVTTAPLDITVAKDTSVITSRVEAFVKAYNAINQLLSEVTKFDPSTKSGALLQGDSSALSLQNSLRSAVQSVSKGSEVFKRLSDIGVSQLRGGDLAIDSTKLASSISNSDELKKMFTSTGGGSADGIAVKVKALATSLLSSQGFFSTKEVSFNLAVKRNTQDQALVNERASQVEASLNKRYADLDAKMSNLNALNAYVTQQVATWNKQT